MCRRPEHPGFSPVQGFSLVEVLIATALLITAIASLAQLFAVAAHANRDAGDTTWATVLAAQKIEELRADSFPAPVDGQSVEYLDSSGDRMDDPGSTRRAYTRRWWIEPLPMAPDSTMAITVVVARYQRGDDPAHDAAGLRREAVRLVTLRARNAP